MDSQPQNFVEDNSLESPGTVIESQSPVAGGTEPTVTSSGSIPPTEQKVGLKARLRKLFKSVNVYFLLFLLILLIAAIVTVLAIQKNRKLETNTTATQTLTQQALDTLKGSDAKVGDAKQILTIESNAVFSGKVLIRDSLDVAGPIKVGGALSLPGITVSGTSSFDQVQINNLSISGNTAILGQLSVQKSLTVSGGATFGGPISAPQLTIDTLQLSKDLQLNRHIDAGGGIPRVSGGGAVGGGGTVSISGSDTAGTVTINTGGSPAAGNLANITFAASFSQTPHVVITPVGSGAAGLNYYITRTTAGFTINTTNAPPGGTTFSFDFIAID